MISKLNIQSFGLFNGYSWDTSVGKNETFRRLNIIYGRNYTGKTTLARILKCIEDNKLHDNYQDCDFEITLLNGTVVTQDTLDIIGNDFKFRIYNTDFVKENLSWLHNDDGTIEPFTILGAKNVEIDKKIKEIDEKLGTVEDGKGLLFVQAQTAQTFEQKQKEHSAKQWELDEKLKNKAKLIKNAATIFNYTTYTITTIKADIPNALKKGELSDEQIQEKKKLLKEESKGTIENIQESKPQFANFFADTDTVLKKKIKPSEPIAELVSDSLLQEWVRQGIDKHKGKRETCGFCGNPIDDKLWEKLDAHFSKESEQLRKDIKAKIDSLEQAKINLNDFLDLNKDQFYANHTVKFEALLKQWNSTIKSYGKSIDKLISELKEREKDIFKERELGDIQDVSQTIFETLQEFNKLIEEHNKKTETLAIDQQTAQLDLRLSEVAKFLIDIDYSTRQTEIAKLLKEESDTRKIFSDKRNEIELLNEEKRTLEAQAKDESKGAELVNLHLSHFFGHNELKLIAEEVTAEGETPKVKFRIVREGEYAKNLSEGECSLISFCYFIAKMEDELKGEVDSSKLIIYIDDPISSLDSNHIFFMFSLIESIIAKPNKYCQLFISTHNLDFLKYLKKLTTPKYKPTPESKDKKADIKHFLIERKSKSNTILRLAPDYLKNYITEFNYLFCQIYNCSISDNSTIAHDYQYNFGNNMRKFLEAYLFYKYPSNSLNIDQRLEKFFENDNVTINLVNRVINEYSHLGEHFDRGLEPIDVDAIKKISQAVLNKIEQTDKEQYEALLESVQTE